MYESVISLISGGIASQLDNEVYKAIERVGVAVNKEELIRALSYDRQQYEKGYADGRADSQRRTGRWIIEGHRRRCDKCGTSLCMIDRDEYEIPDNFCPNCGADMRVEGVKE